jgi:hypothetical protein
MRIRVMVVKCSGASPHTPVTPSGEPRSRWHASTRGAGLLNGQEARDERQRHTSRPTGPRWRHGGHDRGGEGPCAHSSGRQTARSPGFGTMVWDHETGRDRSVAYTGERGIERRFAAERGSVRMGFRRSSVRIAPPRPCFTHEMAPPASPRGAFDSGRTTRSTTPSGRGPFTLAEDRVHSSRGSIEHGGTTHRSARSHQSHEAAKNRDPAQSGQTHAAGEAERRRRQLNGRGAGSDREGSLRPACRCRRPATH